MRCIYAAGMRAVHSQTQHRIARESTRCPDKVAIMDTQRWFDIQRCRDLHKPTQGD